MASGSNNVGRPRLQVDVEEIAEMRKLGVSISKISEVLGLSRSTLYRVLEGSDLIDVTEISDQELDSVVASYKETHPNDGERILIGYIRSKNIHVPRSRIRSSIRRVDPHAIQQRKLTTFSVEPTMLKDQTMCGIWTVIINLLDGSLLFMEL